MDRRKSPIRGLWERNGTYFARLTVPDPITGRKEVRWVRLQSGDPATLRDAQSVAEAQAAMRVLITKRDTGILPTMGRKPRFDDYEAHYLAYHARASGTKRLSTMKTETVHLKHWVAFLGETRLDRITLARVREFVAVKQTEGWAPRTVNLAVTCLRNVLNFAIEEKILTHRPSDGYKPQKIRRQERKLITADAIERLCKAGMVLRNGQEFVDYIRVMAYAGTRRNETLHLKWADVNWERRQLTVGSDGETKNGQSRTVDFNGSLETHLRAMAGRRQPDSEFLFPAPRRGEADRHAKTFVEAMRRARITSGLGQFGFHDLRHYFISMAVMAGIDFLTIARWVGHQDGGLLIGTVYGHLSAEHGQRQAQRLNF